MSPRIVVAALLCGASATAEEKKNDAPQITAITPLSVVAGETQTVRLRGLKLKEVTEIRSTPALGATVKEKKDAAPPNGLEAKDVGDQELVIDEHGRVLQYRLLNSSGSLLFDQSALDALAKVAEVRPPPEGMDRTIVVKFFPPT